MGLHSLSCLLLLLLLLVPASRQQCSNTDPCLNQPDCTGCAANDLVPDPNNCRGFYICLSETEYSDLPFLCDEGQVFNATTHECVPGTDCENCPVVPPTGSCTYECTANGLMSSSTDCGKYYTCDSLGAVSGSVTCETSTPFFNGEVCQTDERFCCHCRPYCTADDLGKTIADPLDCRRYYLCTAASEVPTVSGACPNGENFDPVIESCSASAACAMQVSCLNVVSPDGCIDPFTCLTTGDFPKCPYQCTPEYYFCPEVTGTFQDTVRCFDGYTYHPDKYTCVPEDECP